jgi:iron complex outermembrane receptor protein
MRHRASAIFAASAVLFIIQSVPAYDLDDEPIDHLAEVVVTARKREENLQSVPISVAVYSADELKQQSVASLSDLGQIAPNFFFGQQVQSGNSAGQLYIRGVGQHDTNSTFNPSVGLYVDGVYVSRATTNDLDLADVDRVEVLYGPQGTLFGKNTNGGAVNIVTKGPDLAAPIPSGSAEMQAGDYRRFDALGTLNVPLITNTAALLISADRRTQEGYSRRADGEQQANQNRTSARVQLLFKPAESFEAVLRVDGTTIDEHSGAYKLIEVRTVSTVPMLYAAFTPYRYDNRWLTTSDYSYDGTGPNKNAGTVWGTSITLSWDHSWGTVKAISAFRRLDIESDFDPDGSPLSVLDVFNSVEQHQLSQEIQATGTWLNGRLDWVAGLYYFHETVQDNQPANVALEYFRGAANFDPQSHVINQNYAAYGQSNFLLTSNLKLTLGARVGEDQAQVGRVQVDYPIPTVEQPYVRKSAGWASFLPRLSLQSEWTPDVMTYLSAAEGSKSGGFNGRAGSVSEFNGFQPERVWTYELGLRSDWLDKRLRLNATAYYSVYSDFQILLNSSVTDPTTGQPVAFSFVGNMPKATITGGEASLSILALEGLEFFGGVGITDGKYIRVLPGAPASTHDQFVDAPKVTATAASEYSFPWGRSRQLVGRLDYVHKSTIQFDYGNSPLVVQRPYGLVNARLTLNMSDSRASVFGFVTNLTDVHYAVGGLDDGANGSLGEVVKLMGAPREWGIGARYRF